MYNVLVNLLTLVVKKEAPMLFSELAKRVAEKYPEVKTAYPMDCELSNVELYDPSGGSRRSTRSAFTPPGRSAKT
jgi:hypothetical protein